MFFGENGAALTGKEATLLAATTKGRPDFVPPTIAATVGKKRVVIADVKQETLDADDELMIFNVSKVELIDALAPTEPSSSHTGSAAANKSAALIDPSGDAQNKPDNDKSPEATPVRDIIETTDTDVGEDTSSTPEGKKRKNTAQAAKSQKKSATNDKKGAAKELFPSKQKN